jgi:hypothetical protein
MIVTKLKFMSLSTITRTINTIETTKTKIVNLDPNELLIETKRVFDLARATTIKMIQD